MATHLVCNEKLGVRFSPGPLKLLKECELRQVINTCRNVHLLILKNMNQKGFIQIPILIAIIVGVLFLGGGGYFGVKQYQNYQKQKKQIQQQAESQQKAFRETQQEIDKLKIESEQSKNQQNILEQKINQEASKPKEITIQASELAPYLTGVGEVECGNMEGTGSLWKFSMGYFVLTNDHVIEKATNCTFTIQDSPNDTKHSGAWKLEIIDNSWNNITDISLLRLAILPAAIEISTSIPNLNYLISSMPKCPTSMDIGSPMVIIGYPAYAEKTWSAGGTQSFRTVTNGIISSHDTSVKYDDGLPYSNYFVSAKIDSGNSGGITFSKTSSGLCILGVPTWLTIGNYETQGLVQNIHNVMYAK